MCRFCSGRAQSACLSHEPRESTRACSSPSYWAEALGSAGCFLPDVPAPGDRLNVRAPRRHQAASNRLMRALGLAQAGEAEAALAALCEEGNEEPVDLDVEGLKYILLQRLGRDDGVLDLISKVLVHPLPPLARSTWHLRRGLLHLEARRPHPALQDLQEVLRLAASHEHEEQARAAMLRAAEQLSTH